METKKRKYNFDVIFQKLSELKDSGKDTISYQELQESREINQLREIVIDVSEEAEQYFSTA